MRCNANVATHERLAPVQHRLCPLQGPHAQATMRRASARRAGRALGTSAHIALVTDQRMYHSMSENGAITMLKGNGSEKPQFHCV